METNFERAVIFIFGCLVIALFGVIAWGSIEVQKEQEQVDVTTSTSM